MVGGAMDTSNDRSLARLDTAITEVPQVTDEEAWGNILVACTLFGYAETLQHLHDLYNTSRAATSRESPPDHIQIMILQMKTIQRLARTSPLEIAAAARRFGGDNV